MAYREGYCTVFILRGTDLSTYLPIYLPTSSVSESRNIPVHASNHSPLISVSKGEIAWGTPQKIKLLKIKHGYG